MTSPAMENRVCTVQVYHFIRFVTHVKNNYGSGPSGAREPWFIELPEPPVSIHHCTAEERCKLLTCVQANAFW